MANPNDFIVQPVNALGAYMSGIQARQQQVQGQEQNALLKMQQQSEQEKARLYQQQQGQGADKAQQDKHRAMIEDLSKATDWVQQAQSPEEQAQRWNQVIDAYKPVMGDAVEQYRDPRSIGPVSAWAKQQLQPNPQTYEIGGRIIARQPDGSFKEVYTAPDAGKPKPRDPPSGYQPTPDGSGLAPIPGGPADPATISAKPTPLSAEVKNKLGQLDVAERAAKEYAALVVGPDGAFDEVKARLPAANRILKNAIRAKLRAESGATITEEEVEGEMERYGPALLSSGGTNAAATQRLLDDLALTRQTLSQEPVAQPSQPSASPGKVRRYNPATGKIE